MRLHLLLLASACIAAPAFADHTGPSIGSGGGLSVAGPETLDAGHSSGGVRFSFTRPDQRSDAELEALAAQQVHAHNTDYNLNASLGLAYGITHHLTLSAELPFVRRDSLREGEHSQVGGIAVNQVARLGTVAGVGDLNLLAKYRLTQGESGGVALIGGVKLPTGSTHKHSAEGERLETEHQPGTGSVDAIIGAAAGAALGPLQLDASALYQVAGKGAQHSRLGNRAQGGISLSHRFGPAEPQHDEAGHHDHGHEHGEQVATRHSSWDAFVEMTGEWEGRQRVDGQLEQASGGKSLWVSPGARFVSASGYSVAGAVGVPLWQDIRASHPDNSYRLTVAVGRAF